MSKITKIIGRAFVGGFALAASLSASGISHAAETGAPAPLSNYRPSAPLDTRGDYISIGAKAVFWGDKTLSGDLNASGDAGSGADLKIEYDDALYYHLTLGNAIDLPLLRFRYDIEAYFGDHDATLTKAGNSVDGEIAVYGFNLNAFYDLPTIWRFTPYVGASAMAVGMKLEFADEDETAVTSLNSHAVTNYLGDESDFTSTEGFNLLYGYGFMAGARIELASWLALDGNYRVIRFEDCVISKGCDLLRQETAHEVRAELVLRY